MLDNSSPEKEKCYGCHQFMDPIGFLFEHFDAIGQHRTSEPVPGFGDKPVKDDGFIRVLELENIQGLTGLSEVLNTHEAALSCFIKKLTSFAASREMKRRDRDLVADLVSQYRDGASSLTAISMAVATSDVMRFVETPSLPPKTTKKETAL